MASTLKTPLLQSVPSSDTDSRGSDLESGESVRPDNGEVPLLRKKPVHMNFNAAVTKSFRRLYGIDPLLSSSKTYHQHPHLAYERSTLEQRAHKLASKLLVGSSVQSVYNVGAAPARVHHIPGVRCLVPQLQPGDSDRLRAFADKPNVCKHTLQDCLANIPLKACPNCVPFGCSVFTHSVYYIPPVDLVKWLSASETHTAFAIAHDFSGGSGGFHGEANWFRQSDQIIMRVKGNTHTYSHPFLPWQGQAGFETPDGNVEVEVVETLGVTTLYRLSLVPYKVVNPAPAAEDWTSLLVDHQHQGPIHIPPTALGLTQSPLSTELKQFDLNTLKGDGDFLFVSTLSKREIVVPRGLIATVAFRTGLQARDPALVSKARAVAAQYLESSAIPITLKPQALVLGVALGLCINVQLETSLMNDAVTNYSGWWRAHSRIVNLLPIPVWGRWTVVIMLISVVLLMILVGWLIQFDPSPDNVLSTLVIFALIFVAFMILAARHYYVNLHASNSSTWNADVRHASTAGYVSVPITPSKAERGFPGTTALAPPLPVPDSDKHSLQVQLDPRPMKNPGKPPDRTILSGIAISSAVPTVVEPTQTAEISGITNRILVEQPDIDPKALAVYTDFAMHHPIFTQLDAIRVSDTDKLFEWWVLRYPESRRSEFREARNAAMDRGFVEGHHKGRAFVKQEKKLTITPLGSTNTRPRMVTAFSSEIIACSGPYLNRYSSEVAKMWCGPPLVYTRGMSADKVGEIVRAFLEESGGVENVLALENDFKTMDATIQPAHTSVHETRWKKSGACPVTISAFTTPDVVRLSTRHGVRAKAPSQVSSGQARTNLIDSQVNAAALLSWAFNTHMLDEKPRVLLLVMGDDGILFIPRNQVRMDVLANELAESLSDHLSELAFKPVCHLRLNHYDMEFCSKLFWPVKAGLVLGPKPGRILHRIGWSLTAAGAANLAGAVQSLKQDCCFIPFLGPFLRKLAELTKNQKVKQERNADEWMFHTSKYHEQTNDTWLFFEARYGLTRQHEADFIKILDRVTTLPAVVSYEPLDAVIKRDD